MRKFNFGLIISGLIALLSCMFIASAMASEASSVTAAVSLTGSFWGMLALGIFVLAYGLVIAEENIHLRKSKPMVVAAGVIWILVALA